MDLLHDVEGDGHDAAGVLTHSYTSGKVTQKLNAEPKQKLPLVRGSECPIKTKRLHPIWWCAGLTQAMSGWAQTG